MRIVLTGGPGAGKTLLTEALASQFPDRFALVPEAATQVYGNLQTRWDLLDLLGRREVQRRIYLLQREQEERLAHHHPDKILLLDRGTIDGAAYWPDGAEDYWQDLGTDHATELSRYDTVIWLETAATLGIYDGPASNACRFEDPAGAVASGKRLLELWGPHPNLKHVGAFANFDDKLAAVREVLGAV
jgi:hypothetical protein